MVAVGLMVLYLRVRPSMLSKVDRLLTLEQLHPRLAARSMLRMHRSVLANVSSFCSDTFASYLLHAMTVYDKGSIVSTPSQVSVVVRGETCLQGAIRMQMTILNAAHPQGWAALVVHLLEATLYYSMWIFGVADITVQYCKSIGVKRSRSRGLVLDPLRKIERYYLQYVQWIVTGGSGLCAAHGAARWGQYAQSWR